MILEEAVPLNEIIILQTKLAEKLQDSLSLLHTKALESSEELAPVIKPENLQRISEIITHLQDNLESVMVNAPVDVEDDWTRKYRYISVLAGFRRLPFGSIRRAYEFS